MAVLIKGMEMTNECAIKILKGAIKKPNTEDGYLGQAISMAIKALEQPCEDCVSREAAMDECVKRGHDNSGYAIQHLPSVIPKSNYKQLSKEIAEFKRHVHSENSDYLTGYLSALSAVEEMIAEMGGGE